MASAKYTYDAFGQRIRFREIGSYQNQTFWIDALLLFREVINKSSQNIWCFSAKSKANYVWGEKYNDKHCHPFKEMFYQGVIYKINHHNRTCKKEKLRADFHPMEVPKNATLLGQVILGGSSGPGEGLLVNSWYGEMKRGKNKWEFVLCSLVSLPLLTSVLLLIMWCFCLQGNMWAL